jgi:hypothetical protein
MPELDSVHNFKTCSGNLDYSRQQGVLMAITAPGEYVLILRPEQWQ